MKFVSLILVALLHVLPTARAAAPWADSPPPGMKLNRLFTLSSDRDDRKADVYTMIDTKNQVAGVYMDPTTQILDSTANNIFWLQDIESKDGALLLESRGYKLAFLQGLLNRETQEGHFEIRYLANGLTKTYESCDFNLRRNGLKWYVQNIHTGRMVTQVKVITWSLGIKTLQGICEDETAY